MEPERAASIIRSFMIGQRSAWRLANSVTQSRTAAGLAASSKLGETRRS